MDKIINGDCIIEMAKMPEKSMPLIIADPPYNIGKAEWDKIDNYLEWCGGWLKACERVLANNGSLYVFHNDMPFIVKLMGWIESNTDFVFKQMIIWNKRFAGVWNKDFYDGRIAIDETRTYYRQAEYILFYTFQNETGLQSAVCTKNLWKSIANKLMAPVNNRQQIYDIMKADGRYSTSNSIKVMAGYQFGWGRRFDLISKKLFDACNQTFHYDFTYKELRMEYEKLKVEYEELRYTFNNQKTHHSVWNYETVRKSEHPTQKPVDLLQNIIKHSSNVGDLICDPFMGSGSTAVAAIKTGRHYIGIEKDADYCQIAKQRIIEIRQEMEDETRQIDMFQAAGG